MRHLDRAFITFFEGRAAYSTFKKKRTSKLAKMETPLDIRWSHPLPADAKPSSATISKDGADRYFLSTLTA